MLKRSMVHVFTSVCFRGKKRRVYRGGERAVFYRTRQKGRGFDGTGQQGLWLHFEFVNLVAEPVGDKPLKLTVTFNMFWRLLNFSWLFVLKGGIPIFRVKGSRRLRLTLPRGSTHQLGVPGWDTPILQNSVKMMILRIM